jgi:radical SAM PhpK family P-methyltransferase
MSSKLDCLVVGYHDMDFSLHEQMLTAKGTESVEFGIFLKDHVRIDGRPLPYLDVLNYFQSKNSKGPRPESYYHLSEIPNAAATYLVSNLRRRGYRAQFISHFGAERHVLADMLSSEPPLTVVLTTTFYLSPVPVSDMTAWLKSFNQETKIIVGGPLVGNLARDLDSSTLSYALKTMGADVYIRDSQGEATLCSVLTCLQQGGDSLADIPNLYLPTDEGYRFTGMKPENNSLDEWAISWGTIADHELGTALQTRTARSCAFSCSFCDYPTRAGALALADLATVERELSEMAELGTRSVIFVDDTFNIPPNRFKDICSMLVRRNFGFEWFSYFRCSNARDPEIFDLMRESGCTGVFLGIESGDDRVLKNMNKKARIEQYEYGMAQLHSRGIATFASFITGFPGETPETVDNTIDFINRTKPTFFRCEPWWYNHNSPIHARFADFGLRGRDYQWEHRTMDNHGATEAADRAFRKVNGSTWMPMYNFDFWALPYLMSKGMTLEQIVDFHRLCRNLMDHNLNGSTNGETDIRQQAAVTRLESFLLATTISPSRFAIPDASRTRLLAG